MGSQSSLPYGLLCHNDLSGHFQNDAESRCEIVLETFKYSDDQETA